MPGLKLIIANVFNNKRPL